MVVVVSLAPVGFLIPRELVLISVVLLPLLEEPLLHEALLR
jgi:hypothetical protein